MNEQSFDDAVARIEARRRDSHAAVAYAAEAYYFLREGLDYTAEKLKRTTAENRHVTGRELSIGLRDYALEEFGPLAGLTLAQWGVCETADFGRMVFDLVSEGVFGKTSEDKIEDFTAVYDFDEAFAAPFKPLAAKEA